MKFDIRDIADPFKQQEYFSQQLNAARGGDANAAAVFVTEDVLDLGKSSAKTVRRFEIEGQFFGHPLTEGVFYGDAGKRIAVRATAMRIIGTHYSSDFVETEHYSVHLPTLIVFSIARLFEVRPAGTLTS